MYYRMNYLINYTTVSGSPRIGDFLCKLLLN